MLDARQHMRILELPSMTVAAIQCISASPEADTLDAIIDFIGQHQFIQQNLNIRHFGYVPRIEKNGNADTDAFVRMISIPKETEVIAPFQKRCLPGGLYAAWTVPISFFDKISELRDLVRDMNGFELEYGTEYDSLEEYLNGWLLTKEYANRFFSEAQTDLMVRVRKKSPT